MTCAQGGTRRQKLRITGRVLGALPAIIALPIVIVILLIAVAVYAAANLAIAVVTGAWREATQPDPHAAGPYSMNGINPGDVQRFHAELMGLCEDMARAAARADARDLGEGTDQ